MFETCPTLHLKMKEFHHPAMKSTKLEWKTNIFSNFEGVEPEVMPPQLRRIEVCLDADLGRTSLIVELQ